MKYPDLNEEDIINTDKQNMFEVLKNFHTQMLDAITIGKECQTFPNPLKSNSFFVLGMGGSAISGDLLNSYLKYTAGCDHNSIQVVRDYTVPGTLNESSNVIASSYSGETEETLSSLEIAKMRTKNIVAVTTGGSLEKIANAAKIPVTIIPKGYQPRCALAYSFFPMIYTLLKSGAFEKQGVETTNKNIAETIENIKEKSNIYSELSGSNPAYSLAKQIYDTIPVIYSSDKFGIVNLRWRCQIQENAKNLVFGSILPEMNHNEINSFLAPENNISNLSVLLLRDIDDHPRTKVRFDAINNILTEILPRVITIKSDAPNYMARMFDMIYLGDWVSYYLALLNGIDPTPIPLIIKLKNILSKTS